MTQPAIVWPRQPRRQPTGRYLSAREAGWLLMYGSGMTWQEVAAAALVSRETIRTALKHTRRRWGVTNTAELIAAAMRAGVLP